MSRSLARRLGALVRRIEGWLTPPDDALRTWQGLPGRVTVIFSVALFVLSTPVELYQWGVSGKLGNAGLVDHLQEDLLVTVLASMALYGLLRLFARLATHSQRRREFLEVRHRLLFEYSMDGLLLLTSGGRILAANPTAQRIFGQNEDELRALGRSAILDESDPKARGMLEERLRTGQAHHIIPMKRADGATFVAEVSAVQFETDEGAELVSVIVRDVTERRRQEAALANSEARLRSVYEHSMDAIWLSDPVHGRLLACNRACEELFGRSEAELKKLTTADVVDPESPGLDEFLAERDRTGRARGVLRVRAADGSYFPVEATTSLFHNADGELRSSVIVRDISEQRRAEERMRLVTAAFKSADECMLICDKSFIVREFNDAYLETTGHRPEDALASRPSFLDFEEQARKIGRALESSGHWSGELMQRRADGDLFVSKATISVVEHDESGRNHLVVTFTDISGLRAIEEHVHYLSLHDAVTGLPNRQALRRWFQTNATGKLSTGAMLYLDLDRFKTINETDGHSRGDTLLRELALRLKRHRGPDGYAVSLGGDAFIIMLGGVEHADKAVEEARRFQQLVEQPHEIDGRRLATTASVGISLYPRHGSDVEELLRAADAALHTAKRAGRRGVRIFSPTMHEEVERKVRIERELWHALDRQELHLNYQPLVRLPGQRVTGAEALVRWDSRRLGAIPPDQFIDVAEESGLIVDIGFWVLDEACQQLRKWMDLSPHFDHLSINVSTLQLREPDFVPRLKRITESHGVSPEWLRLEITESVMLLEPEWAIRRLVGLRELGFGIAIDDFGTGYSSMTYLQRLPVQYLKLDRSFSQRLPLSESDASILQAIITLAHRLGIRVVAEGIESREQLELLSAWGCDEAQGFLFSRPLSAEEFRRSVFEGKAYRQQS